MTGRGGQQGSIRHVELRPRHLPAQDLELVAEHQQLDLFSRAARVGYEEALIRARTAR